MQQYVVEFSNGGEIYKQEIVYGFSIADALKRAQQIHRSKDAFAISGVHLLKAQRC